MLRFSCPTCGHRDELAEPPVSHAAICLKCGRHLDLSDARVILHSPRVRAKGATPTPAETACAGDTGERANVGFHEAEAGSGPHRVEDQARRCDRARSGRDGREWDDEQPRGRGRQYDSSPWDGERIDRRRLNEANSKKIAAGLCAIFLGTFGIHKFILGFTLPGVVYLLLTICSCGLAALVMWVFAVAEGVIYLSKSDRDFYETYMLDKRQWF